MTRERTLLTTGVAGTVLTGPGGATLVLAVGLGALGLAAWLGSLDAILFPSLVVFLGITVRARGGAEARGGDLEMGRPRSLPRRLPRGVVSVGLVVTVALAGRGPASAGETRSLPFEMFRALQGLMPEVGEVRLCGLTRAGHTLWAQGQLRVPLSPSVVAVGALMPDHELWAVLLELGAEPAPCDGLLVVARSGPTWRRLLWQRLHLEPGVVPTGVLWDGSRAAVLVDTGERKRLTAPATLRWEAGRVVHAAPGFVIDVRLIRHVLWWRADGQRLEYRRLAVPLEIPDASEEGP